LVSSPRRWILITDRHALERRLSILNNLAARAEHKLHLAAILRMSLSKVLANLSPHISALLGMTLIWMMVDRTARIMQSAKSTFIIEFVVLHCLILGLAN
jgi:hypothetical protein